MAPITDWKLPQLTNWLPAGAVQFSQPEVRRVTMWIVGAFGSALLLGWTLRLACLTGEIGFAMVLCIAASAGAMTFRWLMVPADRSTWSPIDWGKFSLPLFILLMAAVLFAFVNSFLVLLVLAVLLGTEAASWSWALRFDTGKPAEPAVTNAQPTTRAATNTAAQQATLNPLAPALHPEEPIEPGLIQQVTRLREDDQEIIRGIARAEFQAGQRRQTIHLAFCPQLAEVPEFFVESVDGPEARVQTADLQPFGARLEITLPTIPDNDESVIVEFYGTATS